MTKHLYRISILLMVILSAGFISAMLSPVAIIYYGRPGRVENAVSVDMRKFSKIQQDLQEIRIDRQRAVKQHPITGMFRNSVTEAKLTVQYLYYRDIRIRNTLLIVFASWIVFCYISPFLFTNIFLLSQTVRKPIFPEEVLINRCFDEIATLYKKQKRYRVNIEEKMHINAFAIGHNTIVLSKGCINMLTDEEIIGVLAHEIGHLTHRDTFDGMAYDMARRPAFYTATLLKWIFRKWLRAVSTLLMFGSIFSILGLSLFLTGVVLAGTFLLPPIVLCLIFILVNAGVQYLVLLGGREIEYERDRFAAALGVGPYLRLALTKIGEHMPQGGNAFYYLTCTHPIIHNRIRRLEKAEGIRTTY